MDEINSDDDDDDGRKIKEGLVCVCVDLSGCKRFERVFGNE